MAIFLNSMPKSGTNLLSKYFDLSGLKYERKTIAASSIIGRYELIKRVSRQYTISNSMVNVGLEFDVTVKKRWIEKYVSVQSVNGYITGHAPYSAALSDVLTRKGYKTIVIIRNPFATIASMVNYTKEIDNKWHPSHKELIGLPFDKSVERLIRGGDIRGGKVYLNSIVTMFKKVDLWHKSGALIVRYEDLVGEKAGGSADIQFEVAKQVSEYIGLQLSNEQITCALASLYGGTPTFRQGTIDGWKKLFSDELLQNVQDSLKSLDGTCYENYLVL